MPVYRVKDNGEKPAINARFVENAKLISTAMDRMNEETRVRVEAELLAAETMATARLSRVRLNRKEVMSVLLHELGGNTSSRAGAFERGMVEFTLDVHKNFDAPLTRERLLFWHSSVMRGHRCRKSLCGYRSASDDNPPFVELGDKSGGFEGVYPYRLDDELNRFIEVYNTTFVANDKRLGPVKSLLWIHIYFLQIGPFRYNNYLIARTLLALTISRALGYPVPIKMSMEIHRNMSEYYRTIGREIHWFEMSGSNIYLNNMAIAASERALRVVEMFGDSPGSLRRMCATWFLRATRKI